MIYSNLEFCVLLSLTLAAYLAAPGRSSRLAVLLVSSLIFYLWAGWKDTAIFLAVVLASWLPVALSRQAPRSKTWLVRAGISVLAGHLFFWKYASWAVSQVQCLWPGFLGGRSLDLPLPIGISFFTLQGIAYLVDFSRDDAKYMPFMEYLLFKSFFAQLVAGPIVRAKQLVPQLELLARPTPEDRSIGLALFTLGFCKKLALADRIAPFVDEIFLEPQAFGRAVLIKAALGYSVQIWADFSGYTDMGRGAARMLGIRLPENFLSPYFSRSPSEFWRRWHITLSAWIRDYLYIPLGGGQGSNARVFCVVILVMSLSGLWHGASWHFLAWGLYHGALLALDRHWLQRRSPVEPAEKAARIIATFALVTFGWVIFRAPSMTTFFAFMSSFAAGTGNAVPGTGSAFALYFCAMVLIQSAGYYDLEREHWPVVSWLKGSRLWSSCATRPAAALGLGALAATAFISAIFLQPAASAAFIYFQF